MATQRTEVVFSTGGADDLNRTLARLQNEAGKFQRSLNQALSQAGTAAGAVPGKLRLVDRGLSEVRREAEQLTARLGPLGAGLRALGPAGLALGAGIAGITLGLANAARAAIPFQAALSDLSALTGATGRDLKRLESAALDFGTTSRLSATEALTAFKRIASAKPELLANVDALVATTKAAEVLADATGLDLVAASESLTTTLNQFSLSAEESNRVINVLAAGAQLGAAEVPKLTEALVKSGTVAAQAGISLEELVAVLERLLEKGSEPRLAGTALTRIIQTLQQQGLGAKLSTEGLIGAIDSLGLKANQSQALIKTFGKEYATVAAQLLEVADSARELTKNVTGTTTAFDQARIRTDNLQGDLERLDASWTTLNVTIGKSEQGPLRGFIQLLDSATDSVTRLVQRLGSLGPTIQEQLAAVEAAAARRGDRTANDPIARVIDRIGRLFGRPGDRESLDRLEEIRNALLEVAEAQEKLNKAESAKPKPTSSETGGDSVARTEKQIQLEAALAKLRAETARVGVEGEALLRIERDQTLAEFEALADKELAAAGKSADRRARIEEALADGRLVIEERFQRQVEALRASEAETTARETAREQERLAEELRRQQEREAEILAEPFRNLWAGVQSAGATAFEQIFTGAEGGAESLADAIKATFTRLAAELTQLLVIRLAVQPLVQGVGGLLGGGTGAGGVLASGGQGIAGGLVRGLGSSLLSSVLGTQGGGLGGGFSSLLGLGGSVAAGGATIGGLPAATLGGIALVNVGTAAAPLTAVVSNGIVTGFVTGSGAFVAASGVPLAASEVAGATGVAGVGAGAGASLGAAAAAGGIVAGIVGAIVNSYAFAQALDGRGRFVSTTRNRLALSGTPGFVAGPLFLSQGNTQAGLLNLLLPQTAQIDAFLGTDLLGAQVSRRQVFLEGIADLLNGITGSRAFFFGGGSLAPGGRGLGRRARGEFDALNADADLQFLVQLVRRTLRRQGGDAAGTNLRNGDLNNLIETGVSRLASQGRDPFEVLSQLVNKLLSFESATRQLTRTSFVPNTTRLREGVTLDAVIDKAALLVEVFGRELPPAIDATSVAAAALARDVLPTFDALTREAFRQSRARAEETGELIIEAQQARPRRLARLRARARRGDEGAVERFGGLVEGLTAASTAVDELRRSLDLLAAPALESVQRFGDIQTALDAISAVKPVNFDQLPDLVGAAVDAIQAWGDAVLGQITKVRELERALVDNRLAIGLEVAALREETDVRGLFDEAFSKLSLAAFNALTSADARLDLLNRRADLERRAAEAEIGALQAAASDRLDAIGALADASGGLRQQVLALQVQRLGTAIPAITALSGEIARTLRTFRTAEGTDRGVALDTVQGLLAQQLDLGQTLFGPGSARFEGLQAEALATLEELLAASEAAERERRDIEKGLADDVKSIREGLATRLEFIGKLTEGVLLEANAELRARLAEIFPDPDQLEAAIADPVVAQTLVANEQLGSLKLIEEHTRALRIAAEGDAKAKREKGTVELGEGPTVPVGLRANPLTAASTAPTTPAPVTLTIEGPLVQIASVTLPNTRGDQVTQAMLRNTIAEPAVAELVALLERRLGVKVRVAA